MERNGDGAWEHTFRAVRESADLVVSAPGTPALDPVPTVLPRPELQDLKVSVLPPAHTGLPPFDQRTRATSMSRRQPVALPARHAERLEPVPLGR